MEQEVKFDFIFVDAEKAKAFADWLGTLSPEDFKDTELVSAKAKEMGAFETRVHTPPAFGKPGNA